MRKLSVAAGVHLREVSKLHAHECGLVRILVLQEEQPHQSLEQLAGGQRQPHVFLGLTVDDGQAVRSLGQHLIH